MKFKVQMKDPDTLEDAIDEAVKKIVIEGVDKEEIEMIREHRKDSIRGLCNKWFEYGEYLTVEIDTDANTCTVIEK